MNAYYIDIKGDPDYAGKIVFDTTARSARKKADTALNVQCRRSKAFDGMENASDEEIALKKYQEGWWGGKTPTYNLTDEQFLGWYRGR